MRSRLEINCSETYICMLGGLSAYRGVGLFSCLSRLIPRLVYYVWRITDSPLSAWQDPSINGKRIYREFMYIKIMLTVSMSFTKPFMF